MPQNGSSSSGSACGVASLYCRPVLPVTYPCMTGHDSLPGIVQAVPSELEEGWYAPEHLMGPLSPVVRASIGAPIPFQDRHFAGRLFTAHP